ncbi:histidinol-phosphatase [Liberiplasma polymorphum]|uniref:histidinol-phosphatase n=1 Tax=Liberiplasma polymorphum TaxID=3374570 RepID=UPI003775EF19
MFKANYHTHHKLCKHAIGDANNYVKEAVRLNFSHLGFSDHAPSHTIDDQDVRMSWSDLSLYINDIKHAQGKYKAMIDVHIGLEVEFYDENRDYYKELLNEVDYLILGQHYINVDPIKNPLQSCFALSKGKDIIQYAKTLEGALKTGYFSLIAHPDLYMCGYNDWDQTAIEAANIICKASKTYNIPLEFNANGIRRGLITTNEGLRYPYPHNKFWEIAKSYDCEVLLSSDCHKPDLLYDDAVKKAESIIESLQLHQITYLNFKR